MLSDVNDGWPSSARMTCAVFVSPRSRPERSHCLRLRLDFNDIASTPQRSWHSAGSSLGISSTLSVSKSLTMLSKTGRPREGFLGDRGSSGPARRRGGEVGPEPGGRSRPRCRRASHRKCGTSASSAVTATRCSTAPVDPGVSGTARSRSADGSHAGPSKSSTRQFRGPAAVSLLLWYRTAETGRCAVPLKNVSRLYRAAQSTTAVPTASTKAQTFCGAGSGPAVCCAVQCTGVP
eukprot:TRINITY_DN18418_c0_g1_i2.p1 TRINITY_DN18418_c0_g1~~TRINITY_DN18418_c0_g1_i2.p1  ORF type:complete len:235 (-),score=41.22 TRINITY_DN18418_c0_g1_i2:1305-2009(-)